MANGFSSSVQNGFPSLPIAPTQGMSAFEAALAGLASHHQGFMTQLFKLLLENAGLGIWLLDARDQTIAVNSTLEKLLGRNMSQIASQGVMDFVDSTGHSLMREMLDRRVSNSEHAIPASSVTETQTLQLMHTSGELLWVQARSLFFEDQTGGLTCKILLVEDETERRMADAALRKSEFVFRSQFEHGNIGMALTSPDKGWMSANAKLCEMLGFTEAELKTMDWAQLTHPDDLEKDIAQFTKLLAGDIDGYELDKRFLRKDGSAVATHMTVSSYRRVPGPYEYVIASIQDITEEKRAEAELRLAACVFSSSQEGILVIDSELQVIDINPAFEALTGHPRASVVALRNLIFDGTNEGTWDKIVNTLQPYGHWNGELNCKRADGSEFPVRVSIDAVKSEYGDTTGFTCVLSDISEPRRHQRELDRIAYFDLLTGLPNRRLLVDRMNLALDSARAQQDKLAVCYIDLDGFKLINDAHGHHFGDQVLKEVGQRLQAQIRSTPASLLNAEILRSKAYLKLEVIDTVARLGGDEFVMLLGGLANGSDCRKTVEQTLRVIAKPYYINGREVSISASVGVSIFPDDDSDTDSLLRHADQAMYRAKDQGKGKLQIFDVGSGQRNSSRRVALSLIGDALDRDEFRLYFQPKVNMRNACVMGAEALIRWIHPTNGLLLPSEFLPELEGHPLAIQMGQYVIEGAFQQVSKWMSEGLDLRLSLNVSAQHLHSEGFVQFLEKMLQTYSKVAPQNITLEIVESAAIGDIDRVADILKTCSAMGFKCALDDFGTGYSSLTLLRRLSVDEVKIDQSFTYNLLENKDDVAIAHGIIALAQAFNCDAVAEGVNDLALGDTLLEMGCYIAQGNAISPAIPGDFVKDWVSKWIPPSRWSALSGGVPNSVGG